MHAGQRNPGTSYRSNFMGMGLNASRMSPEGSARDRGLYNSEFRSFSSREFGHGRGQFKVFQHPPQSPVGKGDILMEAGRLAAEYLVSKGLLPQSALASKWQNGVSRKQVSSYQDFRQQEDQKPAHFRLGPGVLEAGLGRRRYSDDFNSRNSAKDHGRGGYSRNYSSDWGREYGKSESWSNRTRVSSETDDGDRTSSAQNEEQQVSKGDGDGNLESSSSVLAPENEEVAKSEMQPGNNYQDDIISKESLPTDGNDGAGQETSFASDVVKVPNMENIDTNYSDPNQKQIVEDNLGIQQSGIEDNHSGNNDSDLLALCKFAKVPTKTRSSLTNKIFKINSVSSNKEENSTNTGDSGGHQIPVPAEDGGQDVPSAAVLVSSSQEGKCLDSKTTEVVPQNSIENLQELGSVTEGAVVAESMRSQFSPHATFMHNDEARPIEQLTVIGQSIEYRGEKRVTEDSDHTKEAKKPREWLPSLVNTADEHLNTVTLCETRISSVQENASPENQVVDSVNQDKIVNSQHPKIGDDTGVEHAQEKRPFPSSFKICDLNLMEASEVTTDHHPTNQALTYPSIIPTAGVNIDLSISNPSVSGEYSSQTSRFKNIEIINLENDSIPEEKIIANLDRNMESANTCTDEFSSQAQNAGDINDVQDNYDSLMIPEFLANFSNCSTVSEDVNPLQNGIDLHNGEGTLGDDDSIYMSLGEIPFSFIPTWEQPMPREYEKPF